VVTVVMALMKIAMKLNPADTQRFAAISDVISYIAEMSLPFLLMANFARILNNTDGFKKQLLRNGGATAAIFLVFLMLQEGKAANKLASGLGVLLILLIGVVLIYIFIPSLFTNILERFSRKDGWNGRDDLLLYYSQFLLRTPMYALFGIGAQQIFEKVSPFFPVIDVPHMGLQEVWLAWGVVGVVLMLVLFWRLLDTSKRYAQGKRHLYQFIPFGLTMLFTMSGQLLTSSRALMALTFAYVCLCIPKKNPGSHTHSLGEGV
jgi:hypothetical protein